MLTFYLNLVETPEEKDKVEALYYQYRTLMKYMAMKILRNEETAEDAVGDAMVALIENLDRIEDVYAEKTKSFIYIVIRNVSLNRLKKETRWKKENIEDYANLPLDKADPFESVYVKECLERIEELPDIYRDILQLKVYYKMTNREIAKLLRISEALVRKRLERARNLLFDRGEIYV